MRSKEVTWLSPGLEVQGTGSLCWDCQHMLGPTLQHKLGRQRRSDQYNVCNMGSVRWPVQEAKEDWRNTPAETSRNTGRTQKVGLSGSVQEALPGQTGPDLDTFGQPLSIP